MGSPDFNAFADSVGVTFSSIDLLQQAFTHRSYINEHRGEGREHNERLEFLGDAVLELVVTKYLFTTFPEKPEGELTAIRAALVNTMTLSALAGEVKMNDYLLLSKGEAKDTGRARQYILANTFEAFIGALFLDQGLDVAERFISEHVFPLTSEVVKKQLWRDSKSRFQEEAQERASTTPTYTVISESGPDHDKHFVVGVYLGDNLVAEGEGKSKQDAEQGAAAKALEEKGW